MATAEHFIARSSKIIQQMLIIGSAVSVVTPAILTVLLLAFETPVRKNAQSFLGIDKLATSIDVDDLRTELKDVTGQNRIIFMPAGHSYVEEPVTLGNLVRSHWVMGRTERGKDCQFIRGQSLFQDNRGVAYPGSVIDPIRQLGTNPETLYLELEHPDTLLPGRIKLTLSLQYVCDGQTYFDETRPIFFYAKGL